MLRRDTLKLALAVPLAAVLPIQAQDMGPPPGWPSDRLNDWYELLDDALKPDTARRYTNRLRRVHDSIQCGTDNRYRRDVTVPTAIAGLERAAQLRGVELPEAFHTMIARIRRSEASWRPASPEYPLGAAVLFPVGFEAYTPNGEPYWHKKLLAALRVRGRVWPKHKQPFEMMGRWSLPLTRTERGHIAYCPEGVEFDLEWSWEHTNLEGHSFLLSQVWSYDREGKMRHSAYRTADDRGGSRVVLNEPGPYCPVPEPMRLLV